MILLVILKFLVPVGIGMALQWGISRKLNRVEERARLEAETSKRVLLLKSSTTSDLLNELSNRNDY